MIEGFDISNNNGIELVRSYIEKNKPEFCFMKASEGDSFIDRQAYKFYELCVEKNIVTGFYHFAQAHRHDPETEALHFMSCVRPFLEKGPQLLALDFEANSLRSNRYGWISKFCREVESQVNGKVIIYIQENELKNYRTQFNDNGLWLASWGADYRKNPYKGDMLIAFHQDGFRDKLDHDVFYGSWEGLLKYRCNLEE